MPVCSCREQAEANYGERQAVTGMEQGLDHKTRS